MNQKICQVLLAICISFSSAAFANEKVYITPAQVHVSGEAILINMLGNPYPVSGNCTSRNSAPTPCATCSILEWFSVFKGLKSISYGSAC